MILKLIGSILVLAASAFLGYVLSRDFKRRPQELRELQGLLMMLENEINYLSNVLSDAFERISRSSKSPVGDFFRRTLDYLKENRTMTASEAWEASVRDVVKRTALNGEDEEILVSFGKMLGSSDLEGQLKNIKLAVSQLALQEKKAEENRARNEVMYRQLGILGGVAVIIILL